MPQLDSWPGRLTVGSGILIALAVIALPLGGRQPEPRRTAPNAPPPERVEAWFGTLAGPGALDLGDLGDSWELVGALELEELSNGRARLSGALQDSQEPEAFLRLEAELSQWVEEPQAARTPGARAYTNIEGVLRGVGALEGALLCVGATDEIAFAPGTDAARAQVAFELGWVETPKGAPEGWSTRPQECRFELALAHERVELVGDASLVLGSLAGELELLAGGSFVERSDGSASLDGLVARRGRPGENFHLRLDFAGKGGEGAGYQRCDGSLTGLDQLEGARIELRGGGPGSCVVPERDGGVARPMLLASLDSTLETPPTQASDGFRSGEREGSLSLRFDERNAHFAHGGPSTSEPWRDGFVAALGPLGADFVFEAGGSLRQGADGSARLNGLLARRSAPQTAFFLELELERCSLERRGPYSSIWMGYRLKRGSLSGLRERAGEVHELAQGGAPLLVGLGAGDGNTTHGAHANFGVVPAGDARGTTPDTLGLRFDLASHQEDSVEVAAMGGGFQLEHLGDDFFFASGGRLRTEGDGHARLTGVLERENFPRQRFFLELELSGEVAPGASEHPPAGSPNIQVTDADEGSGSWAYYRRLAGSLIGLDDYDGASLRLSARGSSLQVGLGAAGEPQAFGAAASFRVEVLAQPAQRLRIHERTRAGSFALRVRRGVSTGVESAFALPAVDGGAGQALALPGIADDFAFVELGQLREFAGGRACLEGRLQSVSRPELGFDLRIDYRARVAGDELVVRDHRLPSTAYAARGGPVRPELWHYYRRAQGILVGTGDLAGSVIELRSRRGALQVGLGANGRNLDYGATSSFELEARSGPVGSEAWVPDYFPGGELHVDLTD